MARLLGRAMPTAGADDSPWAREVGGADEVGASSSRRVSAVGLNLRTARRWAPYLTEAVCWADGRTGSTRDNLRAATRSSPARALERRPAENCRAHQANLHRFQSRRLVPAT